MTMSTAPNLLETRTGWLLVANKHDQSLGIIDPVSNTQIATVPVGGVTIALESGRDRCRNTAPTDAVHSDCVGQQSETFEASHAVASSS